MEHTSSETDFCGRTAALVKGLMLLFVLAPIAERLLRLFHVQYLASSISAHAHGMTPGRVRCTASLKCTCALAEGALHQTSRKQAADWPGVACLQGKDGTYQHIHFCHGTVHMSAFLPLALHRSQCMTQAPGNWS